MTDRLGDYGRIENARRLLGAIEILYRKLEGLGIFPPEPPPRRRSSPVPDAPIDPRLYPPLPPDPQRRQNPFPDRPVPPVTPNPFAPRGLDRGPTIEVDPPDSNPQNGLPEEFEPPIPKDEGHRVVTELHPWATAAFGGVRGGRRSDDPGLPQWSWWQQTQPVPAEAWTLANVDRAAAVQEMMQGIDEYRRRR